MNPRFFPINVTQAKVHNIACPKAQPDQQEQNRPIAPTNG
jgi:hypothetical protein